MKNNIIILATVIAAVIGGAVGKTVVTSLFERGDSGRQVSTPFDQALVETSKRMNATLPMHVDKETRLDSTMAGPGNRLTYLYTLVNASSDDVDSTTFTAAMKPQLINAYKSSPDLSAFRENHVDLHYQYRDNEGNVVVTIVVSPRDF